MQVAGDSPASPSKNLFGKIY